VEDDGRGFDAEAALMGGEESYMDARTQGLMMLKEKFELVRGTVAVVSSEKRGHDGSP